MKHQEKEPGRITASVEFVRFIMNFAPQFGFDPEKIFQMADFDGSTLEQSDVRIPFDKIDAIWKALEENSPDQDIGLHLGEKAGTFPGHILFLLMLNTPTIKDAIEIFCRYFNLLNDITVPLFSTHKDSAALSIRFHTPDRKRSRHIYEGILAVYASVLRRISEDKIHYEGAYFVHSRPKNISEHHRLFNAPLFFNQSENKLVFKKKYLTLPVHLSNKEVLETLEPLAQKLQERLYVYGPWSEKVVQIIVKMLKVEKPEIELIAKKLGVNHRNLQYRLKTEGTTYQMLLDQVRKEQAVYFLEKVNIPIGEIALLLGYSEQSVFNRAFKRWVGSTPGQYRSQLKHSKDSQ